MSLLYNIGIWIYYGAMQLATLWNQKAFRWVNGRIGLFENLKSKMVASSKETIWMHCASLGEFEQGRPLLEKLKSRNEDLRVVLTFFSPSGYEVMKDYVGADIVSYLPLDTPANAKKFLELVNPKLVLWVKYEYWFNILGEIRHKNIPLILVSGIFRKSQPFFKWYGGFWKRMLMDFTYLFIQNDSSQQLLNKIDFENVSVSGDTRFDRVMELSTLKKDVPGIKEFCGENLVIVAGSTWEEDEVLLIHYLRVNSNVRMILAPHEIDSENLLGIKKEFPRSIFYSDWLKMSEEEMANNSRYNCLILDNVGMLSFTYRYGDVCYVGGGFGAEGVHNVLEAAVYGKPVLFGPEFEKYIEAVELLEAGGADDIKNAIELEQTFDMLLKNIKTREKWGNDSENYVRSKVGATDKIIDFIYKNRLLTN